MFLEKIISGKKLDFGFLRQIRTDELEVSLFNTPKSPRGFFLGAGYFWAIFAGCYSSSGLRINPLVPFIEPHMPRSLRWKVTKKMKAREKKNKNPIWNRAFGSHVILSRMISGSADVGTLKKPTTREETGPNQLLIYQMMR